MNDQSDLSYSKLTDLFGSDIVEQAGLIDAADLNLDERMTACITEGLTRLKQLRNDPASQRALLADMEPGEKLLLCMWIMEMDLFDKICA